MKNNYSIKKFKQFNEMASYNETMTIEDLIYVMEQEDPNNFIVQHNLEVRGKNPNNECIFIVDGFVKIRSNGMKMKNKDYHHSFDGDEYDFYTYKIESNPRKLYGTHFFTGTPEERKNLPVKLTEFKTLSDLIEEAKKIPNPSKSLFFIESDNVGYEKTEKHHSFEAPLGLSNYNIVTYALTKNKEIVSGSIITANMFMGESKGRYKLVSK